MSSSEISGCVAAWRVELLLHLQLSSLRSTISSTLLARGAGYRQIARRSGRPSSQPSSSAIFIAAPAPVRRCRRKIQNRLGLRPRTACTCRPSTSLCARVRQSIRSTPRCRHRPAKSRAIIWARGPWRDRAPSRIRRIMSSRLATATAKADEDVRACRAPCPARRWCAGGSRLLRGIARNSLEDLLEVQHLRA